MRFKALALISSLAVVAACGSDNGPGGGTTLTTQETAALTAALTANGALGGEAAAFAPFALSQLHESGSFAGYDAVGVQVNYTVTAAGNTISGVLSSVVGWDGLNTSANTVDHILAASSFSTGGTFPSTVAGTFGSTGVVGSYYERSTASNYVATTGTFNVTSATFGSGTTNCNSSAGGITVTCSYTTGTMAGSLGFTANRLNGTGAATFNQSSQNFDLPAVRLTITISQ